MCVMYLYVCMCTNCIIIPSYLAYYVQYTSYERHNMPLPMRCLAKVFVIVFTFSFNFIRTYTCACIGFPRCCLYNIIYKHRSYNIIVFYARDNNDNNNIIITVHGVGGLKRLFLLLPPPLHLFLKAGAKDIIYNKTITKS